MEQERIPLESIERKFAQEGFLVLEEGTRYDLELIYTPSDQKPVYLNIGERKILQPKRNKYVTHPGLVLREPILVSRHLSYHRGEQKGEYKFPITNSKILYLEGESTAFQRELINAFDISEDYYECEYPESFGDIDMSLFAYKHPLAAAHITEIEDPYVDGISEEQERLNRAFVQSVLGEDAELKDLTAVRIVTEL
jgi:hypothetical protein